MVYASCCASYPLREIGAKSRPADNSACWAESPGHDGGQPMNFDKISAWAPEWLSVVRIMSALLFLEHGTQKLFNFPPAPEPMQLPALLLVQGLIEVIGGILL